MRDSRAEQIGKYLSSGKASRDAIKVIAYILERIEYRGELEIFISDEIDDFEKD